MSSSDAGAEFSPAERRLLLETALDSIKSSLETGRPRNITAEAGTGKLSDRRACFVTLTSEDMLRGCIGSLEPHTSLADDVSHNAWAAAFRDPRFKPLQTEELAALTIHISVLGTPVRVDFDSEAALVEQLRPGVDGLILQEHASRGTFLPSVWESLPDPVQFLQHLKLKAGLPADYWSDTIQVWRYTTEAFGAAVANLVEGREIS